MSQTNEIVAKPKCAKSLFRDWYSYPCGKSGTVFEGGKHWCKIHAPSIVQAKRDANDKKWRDKQKERDERNDKHDRYERAKEAVLLAAREWRMKPTKERAETLIQADLTLATQENAK